MESWHDSNRALQHQNKREKAVQFEVKIMGKHDGDWLLEKFVTPDSRGHSPQPNVYPRNSALWSAPCTQKARGSSPLTSTLVQKVNRQKEEETAIK